MATATMRISRERKELIAKYATAAVFLYGVISIDVFVSVFNHYEEGHGRYRFKFPVSIESCGSPSSRLHA